MPNMIPKSSFHFWLMEFIKISIELKESPMCNQSTVMEEVIKSYLNKVGLLTCKEISQ